MKAFKTALRMFLAAVCVAVSLVLSGCSGLDLTADDFITPPRANGEMYDIQQTLEKSVTSDYSLKYPTAGKHRSAYILTDLTGSGNKNFAIAFYSTSEAENTILMHMNLMKKVDDDWITLCNTAVNASGVEKVEIIDFNGDGIKEITVGWNIYGAMDKKMNVYTLKGAKLVSLLQQEYTNFICCDLKGNGKDELFLLDHDPDAATAIVTLYSFGKDMVLSSPNCNIDGAVTSFNEPIISKMANGIPAVYIDAVKGTSMQTEIVFLRDGELLAPMYQSGLQTLSPTYRDTTVTCFDVNSDGYLDIPSIEPTESFAVDISTDELSPVTRWRTYTGSDFAETMVTLMNYTDGYYVDIPNRWLNRITITKKIESRLRIIYLWNVTDNSVIGELVRIRAIPEKEWDIENNGFNEYTEITRSEGVVYAAMLGKSDSEESIDITELKERFHVIV